MRRRTSLTWPHRRWAGRVLTIAACTPLLACSLLFAPAQAEIDGDGGAQFDAGAGDGGICGTGDFRWAYQLPVRFTGIAEPQDNVPVGIRFTPSEFTELQLPDDSTSLRFAEASGETMPHEVEAWDPEVGGLVWVLVKKIRAGLELTFQMLYGDPDAASPDSSDELWATAGYSAVFHFDRDDFKDSMGPAFTPEIAAEVTATDSSVMGALGNAMQFPGVEGQTVVIPHAPGHESEDVLTGLSVEARFQPTHAISGARFVLQKTGAYSITSSTEAGNLSLASLSAQPAEVNSPGKLLSTDSWTHAAMVVDVSELRMLYFIDGVAAGEAVDFLARDSSMDPLILGSSFQGHMDELRISEQNRLAPWHALQTALFAGNLQSLGEPTQCAP